MNIGFRQEWWFGDDSIAGSYFRLGYDWAIPLDGMELTVAAFGLVGMNYGTNSGEVLFSPGGGAELRLYPIQNGFFVRFSPLEFMGHIGDYSFWSYQFAGGAGYSF